MKVKYKWPHPWFELWLLNPFPTMRAVIPCAPHLSILVHSERLFLCIMLIYSSIRYYSLKGIILIVYCIAFLCWINHFEIFFFYCLGNVFQVIITFVCDPEHDLGTISFINLTSQLYTFQFKTALACTPHPVDCVLQDQKGGQYDLTPLALPNTNWETTVAGTKYIINVCRPVNKRGNVSCAGKNLNKISMFLFPGFYMLLLKIFSVINKIN